MSRLTMTRGLCQMVSTEYCHSKRDCYECGHGRNVFKRLAAYEDAEEQGLLVRLPCKVGDTVYYYCDIFNRIGKYEIDMVQLYGHSSISFLANWREHGELMDDLDFESSCIGKTIFLTRAEAEAALKGDSHA